MARKGSFDSRRRGVTRADGLAVGYAVVTGTLVAASGVDAWTLGAPTAGLLALVADGVARPGSGVLLPVVCHGPRERPEVALTFDDGPSTHTPAIAAALEAADARGTFFCIGRQLEAHLDAGRALHAAGHELANHSYDHSRLLNLCGPRAMAAEIERGAAVVRRVTGAAQPLYRPPIGLKSPPLAVAARRLELTVVTWSLHGRDTRIGRGIADRVLRRIRPGDIVCLHDGCDRPGADRRPTVEAIGRILEGLRTRGLRAVTVTELLR